MRGTLLALLAGAFLMSGCAPTMDTPNPTYAPTPVPSEPPIELDQPAATATATEETVPPAGPDGQALLQDRCTGCHSLSRVERARKTAEEWESAVSRMIGYGAVLNTEELEVLVQYLAETYPK